MVRNHHKCARLSIDRRHCCTVLCCTATTLGGAALHFDGVSGVSKGDSRQSKGDSRQSKGISQFLYVRTAIPSRRDANRRARALEAQRLSGRTSRVLFACNWRQHACVISPPLRFRTKKAQHYTRLVPSVVSKTSGFWSGEFGCVPTSPSCLYLPPHAYKQHPP
eukprot:gene7315-biopygen10563